MAIYKRGENWYNNFTFKGQRIRESIGLSRKSADKMIGRGKGMVASISIQKKTTQSFKDLVYLDLKEAWLII